MKDLILHGMLCGQTIRFSAIAGKQLVADAQATHSLSRVATAALGRQLLMTSIIASQLKNQTDTVTTVLAGNGPSGNLVCVGRYAGLVKGYATEPAVELPLRADGKLDVGGYVGHSGKLTVIRDLGMKDPYVGMCNLVSGEIAIRQTVPSPLRRVFPSQRAFDAETAPACLYTRGVEKDNSISRYPRGAPCIFYNRTVS